MAHKITRRDIEESSIVRCREQTMSTCPRDLDLHDAYSCKWTVNDEASAVGLAKNGDRERLFAGARAVHCPQQLSALSRALYFKT